MANRPMLFSDPMVRAILEGRKSQTRRVLKPQRGTTLADFTIDAGAALDGLATRKELPRNKLHVPFAVGDLLYVRETYFRYGHWEPVPGATTKGGRMKWGFVPDDPAVSFEMFGPYLKAMNRADPTTPAWHKRLGRFMPRAVSRITLRVTGVKVERLQAITRGDAMAEGCPFANMQHGPDPRDWFGKLWGQINGEASWAANPWVAAYEFEPIFQNIDEVKT